MEKLGKRSHIGRIEFWLWGSTISNRNKISGPFMSSCAYSPGAIALLGKGVVQVALDCQTWNTIDSWQWKYSDPILTWIGSHLQYQCPNVGSNTLKIEQIITITTWVWLYSWSFGTQVDSSIKSHQQETAIGLYGIILLLWWF
jgi:hypothetical protein